MFVEEEDLMKTAKVNAYISYIYSHSTNQPFAFMAIQGASISQNALSHSVRPVFPRPSRVLLCNCQLLATYR